MELRRLENEREELTAAYKEAEAVRRFMKWNLDFLWCVVILLKGRKAEEQRSQRLSAELAQFRHDAEKRLQEKDEEVEAIRWVFDNYLANDLNPIIWSIYQEKCN